MYSLENEANNINLNAPMIMDTSGLWLRRNSLKNNVLCGHIPLVTEETKNLSEEEYKQKLIMPSLINRIPHFEDTKVRLCCEGSIL